MFFIFVTVSRDTKQERAKDIKASDSIGIAVIPSPSEPSLESSDYVDGLSIRYLQSQACAHRLCPVIGCSSEFQIINVRHSHVRLSNRHRTAQNRTRTCYHTVPKFKAGVLHESARYSSLIFIDVH